MMEYFLDQFNLKNIKLVNTVERWKSPVVENYDISLEDLPSPRIVREGIYRIFVHTTIEFSVEEMESVEQKLKEVKREFAERVNERGLDIIRGLQEDINNFPVHSPEVMGYLDSIKVRLTLLTNSLYGRV